MNYRVLEIKDIDSVMEVIEDARELLRLEGNGQWQFGYPTKDDMLKDINNHQLYGIIDNNIIVAVAAFTGYEKDYHHFYEGKWQIESENYLVMHRVAVRESYRSKGYGKLLFELFITLGRELKVDSLRIDTHAKNDILIHLFNIYGFKYCGKSILYPNKDRVMYEKVLNINANDFNYYIFDMDGTLIDSMSKWYIKGVQTIKEITNVDIDINPIETLSPRVKEYIKSVDKITNEFIHRVWFDGMDEEYDHMSLKEGVLEFLDKAYKEGKQMCICTGSNTSKVKRMLKSLNLEKYFKFILSAEDLNMPKWNIDIFNLAVSKFNCQNKDVVIFDDTLSFIKNPIQVNYNVIGVYDIIQTKDIERMKIYSNKYIYSFKELLNDK